MPGHPELTIKNLVDSNTTNGNVLLGLAANPMSYAEISQHIDTTVLALHYFGVGRGDSVALALPNGPLAASAFLSVSCGATCAPLNPACRQEEFEFYLKDLEAKALVVEAGVHSPATDAAQKLGIPLLELKPHGPQAGSFVLQGEPGGAPAKRGLAEPDDVAMVVHTSGTAARPKIVPLPHRNVCASANSIARTLALTPQDRCLNVLPLFHIHGLIGALLSSISAGASVYCTPGFNEMKFYGWLDEVKPTWYSAMPTMHQAILSRASSNADILDRHTLRLICSSSAALPPQVLKELADTFQVPVVESFDEIPKGPSGKIQPIGPAPKLGLTS